MERLRFRQAITGCLLAISLAIFGGCATKAQIVVDPSGAGDYRSLAQAIQNVEIDKGQIVLVRPGEYNEQIQLRSGLQLVGDSRDETVVTFDGEGPVLYSKGGQKISIEGMTFDKRGLGRDPTLLFTDTEVVLNNCAVRGGGLAGIEARNFGMLDLRNSEVTGNAQSGLLLHEQARARVMDSTIAANGKYGIEARAFNDVPEKIVEYRDEDSAHITLESVILQGNASGGMLVELGAHVSGEAITVEGNGTDGQKAPGIVINEIGKFLLTASEVKGNSIGIEINEGADVEIIENTVAVNAEEGIRINGITSPKIHGNLIQYNRTGIGIYGLSEAEIEMNQISFNREHGLEVRQTGNPQLSQNTIHGNGKVGVVVLGAKLFMVNSVVANNGWHGMLIGNGGYASVFENTIFGNTKAGIWFTENSEGNFHHNAVVGNYIGLSYEGNYPIEPKSFNNLYHNNKDADYKKAHPGPGDVRAAPLFANPMELDFTPMPGSPLIDPEGKGKGPDIGATQVTTGE